MTPFPQPLTIESRSRGVDRHIDCVLLFMEMLFQIFNVIATAIAPIHERKLTTEDENCQPCLHKSAHLPPSTWARQTTARSFNRRTERLPTQRLRRYASRSQSPYRTSPTLTPIDGDGNLEGKLDSAVKTRAFSLEPGHFGAFFGLVSC